MAIAEVRRRKLWFGTERRMEWLPTPNRGADVSPQAWNSDGTLLNGGGYVFGSVGSHKQYIFEWPQSSAREMAQKMKSYADGTYGKGLIYFQDPLTYDTNVLPARWADPSMAVNEEGATLAYGIQPTAIPTGLNGHDLPVDGAVYNLNTYPTGFRQEAGAVFIPIPEGYTLGVGSFHSYSGTAGVFGTPLLSTGGLGSAVRINPLSISGTTRLNQQFSGVVGVWLWVGKTGAGNASITLQGNIARLYPAGDSAAAARANANPWIGGQGNSGCRFVGKPTYIENTGVNGGQVGYACTLVEVGSWAWG